jgi:hypothetical protein
MKQTSLVCRHQKLVARITTQTVLALTTELQHWKQML